MDFWVVRYSFPRCRRINLLIIYKSGPSPFVLRRRLQGWMSGTISMALRRKSLNTTIRNTSVVGSPSAAIQSRTQHVTKLFKKSHRNGIHSPHIGTQECFCPCYSHKRHHTVPARRQQMYFALVIVPGLAWRSLCGCQSALRSQFFSRRLAFGQIPFYRASRNANNVPESRRSFLTTFIRAAGVVTV